ncbi:MAG: hypothetical protein NUV97_01235 [archaeon]|nr:hypothetical protein [archaeon]MCR4323414.1 hypothetical protein [Nanoarchaeota archaeon]
MAEDFERFKLKTYDLWDLFLHERQSPYIGRAYAWARRPEADLVSDASRGEILELFEVVIPDWERATRELFRHDRSNVAILGNEAPHLHAHLIPRYQTSRTFAGIDFVDPNPRGNYAPYPKVGLDEAVVFQIRDLMKGKLS